MRNQTAFIAFLLFFFIGAISFAKGTNFGLFSVDVEPIVGYELEQKLVPHRHSKEHIVYGARVIVGLPLVSVESEVTRSNDNEGFPERGYESKDTTDKAKVGLRSTFRLMGIFWAFARAGGQARRVHQVKTVNGVSSTTDSPIYVHPYGGAGLRVRLAQHFRFDADATVVFADTQHWRYYEYQLTAGFAVSFP